MGFACQEFESPTQPRPKAARSVCVGEAGATPTEVRLLSAGEPVVFSLGQAWDGSDDEPETK
jgi:hypothetical protein